MGLTTLGGLMMGTRSGTVDPGLVLHLIQQRGMVASEVADLWAASRKRPRRSFPTPMPRRRDSYGSAPP